MPELVWALECFIDKPFVWHPVADERLPSDRHDSESEPVFNNCSLLHVDWQGSRYAKVQPWRCDGLQVVRIGKEIEDGFDWMWEHLFRLELEIAVFESGERYGAHLNAF